MSHRITARHAGLSLVGLVLAATANAQSDGCATPPSISIGTTPFDTTGNTDSFFDGGGNPCFNFFDPFHPTSDGFFVFTAPGNGNYQFDTIGSGFDTVLQIHAGDDCNATCIIGNVDFGGTATHSMVQAFGLSAGDQILVQVGSNVGTPGQPGVINIAPFATPVNNTCATPTPLTGVGTWPWGNLDATSSNFDGGGLPCISAPDNDAITKDLFFVWTLPTTGTFRVDTVGSPIDTNLALHLGSDCNAVCLAQDYDFGENEILWTTGLAGETYLIQAGGWGNAGSNSNSLNISMPSLEPNDTCATPQAIAGEGTWSFDNVNTTTSGFDGGGGACAMAGTNDQITNDLFYVWTATAPGAYQVDTLASPLAFDTNLSLHFGSDCNAGCYDQSTLPGQDFVQIGGLLAGDVLLIQVGGWQGATGAGVLTIGALPPPPANDTCASPTPIAGVGTWAWDSTFALTSGFNGGGGACPEPSANNAPKHDLFYAWTPTVFGDYSFDTIGTGQDTVLSLHSGSDCSAFCLDFNDDVSIGGDESRAFIVNASSSSTYLIQVGSWTLGDLVASGQLNINQIVEPTNDTCATAIPLNGEAIVPWNNSHPSLTTTGFDGGNSTSCLSGSNNPQFPGGPISSDLFWTWTAPCAGDYRIHTEGSVEVNDTKLNVHTGSDCSATCLSSNDDISTGQGNFLSEVFLTGVQAGDAYLLQTGSWGATSQHGEGLLSIERIGGPCSSGAIGFVCAQAVPHSGGLTTSLNSSYFGSGVGAGLHLEGTDGPPNQFGFFLVAATADLTIPVFSGTLCLGAPQGRYSPLASSSQGNPLLNSIGQFDAAGNFAALGGNSTTGFGFDVPVGLPNPPGGTIDVGETWYFQLWHRDGFDANLSNVVEATF